MSRYYRGCRQAERALLKQARAENVPVLVLWEGPLGSGWAGQISSAPGRISMIHTQTREELWSAIERLHNGEKS